jgi:prepilin peptidase CpaA
MTIKDRAKWRNMSRRMRALHQSLLAPGFSALGLSAPGFLAQGFLINDLCVIAGLALLAVAGLHDCAVRTVPNLLCLVLLVFGVALRLIGGDILHGLLAGAVVFAFCAILWRFGWLGGGDVKLLAAASVFVPPGLVPAMVLYTSLAGGVLAVLYLIAGRLVPPPAPARPRTLISRVARCEQWRLRRRGPLPYAAAIAAGGICATLSL